MPKVTTSLGEISWQNNKHGSDERAVKELRDMSRSMRKDAAQAALYAKNQDPDSDRFVELLVESQVLERWADRLKNRANKIASEGR